MLDEIAKERGASIPRRSRSTGCMHKPGVDTVILGARDEAQLRDNLAAATWRLSPEEMTRARRGQRAAGAVPEWHQHKFGIERNPRLPAIRQ